MHRMSCSEHALHPAYPAPTVGYDAVAHATRQCGPRQPPPGDLLYAHACHDSIVALREMMTKGKAWLVDR